MINLNWLMNHTLYQIFRAILFISLKKLETLTDNPLTGMYVHKTENRIKFKIKTRYYLDILTPETLKLLGFTKHKITKNENSEICVY